MPVEYVVSQVITDPSCSDSSRRCWARSVFAESDPHPPAPACLPREEKCKGRNVVDRPIGNDKSSGGPAIPYGNLTSSKGHARAGAISARMPRKHLPRS
ncbi:hypothetical protein RHA1_ro05299 [Rhodococcus jostii RHA1]|uniref:Uncharacterized protein n=1 Tax=Rhodococcus jostii (strain RHA1) TaxID=101510 RepID=Q0S5V6_RHOJR|nr:hypothetical protein RHA1_ro05299 [Rhodococcus jostii RHA1]